MNLVSAVPSALKTLAQTQRVVRNEFPEMLRRLQSVPRVLKQARDTQVGTTPHDVVLTHGTFKLLRYRRETPALHAEPVLFCYALVNRPYILDLQPDKSIVRRYLERGFEVYMIDWGVPSDADSRFTMDDYVSGYLHDAVTYITRERNCKNVHLLGYCMGGTFSTVYAAQHPERVRTLTLLASPIDFSGTESLLNVWTDPRYFDVDKFVDIHGNCPADFLQMCFLYIKPIQNLIEKKISLYEGMTDPAFVTNYFALERWVTDNIPVAGETFRQFVKDLYQHNKLVRGEFDLGKSRVDLTRVECPLLILTAKNDHLVPPASTEGVRACVRSRDITAMMTESGHVGLVVGGKAQKVVWPAATAWLANRSGSPARSDSPRPASESFAASLQMEGGQHGS
jgi:polyhydroxyalkanoate synthase